jgi:hypothetical protein
MIGDIRRHGRHYAEVAFMTAVTALLLALLAAETRRGLEGLPGMLVYAFAAGFGLESVIASWRGRWRPGGGERQLQR